MGLNASASSINVAQSRPLGGTGGPVQLLVASRGWSSEEQEEGWLHDGAAQTA